MPRLVLVEADGNQEIIQEAMALYRKESPYSICVSMVMLQDRINRLEAQVKDLEHRTGNKRETNG